jgi:uncharacterized low-complexity protein
MKHENNLNRLSLITGAALAMSVASSTSLAAEVNPFGITELPQGFNLAAAEGKCGEGKCGGKSEKEGKCGEGKCGGKSEKEGKCGEGKCGGKSEKEGKCGEGKCGGKG